MWDLPILLNLLWLSDANFTWGQTHARFAKKIYCSSYTPIWKACCVNSLYLNIAHRYSYLFDTLNYSLHGSWCTAVSSQYVQCNELKYHICIISLIPFWEEPGYKAVYHYILAWICTEICYGVICMFGLYQYHNLLRSKSQYSHCDLWVGHLQHLESPINTQGGLSLRASVWLV